MPREKIAAKYTGENDEHYMGLPARDIMEDEFERLSDDQKALLAASSFYDIRHEASARKAPAAPAAEAASEPKAEGKK